MIALRLRHPARRQPERDYAPNRPGDAPHIRAYNAEVLARELDWPVVQVLLQSRRILADLARVLG